MDPRIAVACVVAALFLTGVGYTVEGVKRAAHHVSKAGHAVVHVLHHPKPRS